MIEILAQGERTARKPHRCFHCYRPIDKGERHDFATLKYDDVYTLRCHLDCMALALAYNRDSGGDYMSNGCDEGYPPLRDEWVDSGEYKRLCDAYRGHFPHVITRMEYPDQIAEIRRQGRLRDRKG